MGESDQPDLSYIDLKPLVREVIDALSKFNPQAARNANLVDPFAAVMESVMFNRVDFSTWDFHETERQKQKTLLNAIGDLHQSMLGLLDGVTSYPASKKFPMPDIVVKRGDQKLIAEIKNKHNTMNDRSAKGTFKAMEDDLARSEFAGFRGFVVPIIAPVPSSGQQMWSRFAPGAQNKGREDILITPGRVFYAIVTDPLCRQPGIDFDETEDMTLWSSWRSIDVVTNSLLDALETETGIKVPDWAKDLFPQAIGSA